MFRKVEFKQGNPYLYATLPTPFTSTLFDPLKKASVVSTLLIPSLLAFSPPFASHDDRKRSDSQKLGLGHLSYVRSFCTFTPCGLCGAGAIYLLSDDHRQRIEYTILQPE